MQYERQFLKQVMEQPDYITNPRILQLVRSGYVRVEKGSNTLTLGNLFHKQQVKLLQIVNFSLEQYLLTQVQQIFQTSNKLELLEQLKSVRTVKALPLLTQQPLIYSSTEQKNYFESRTSVNGEYLIVLEFGLNTELLLEELNAALKMDLKRSIFSFGSVLCEEEVDDLFPIYDYSGNVISQQTELTKVLTPEAHTIEQLAEFLKIPTMQTIKAVMYEFGGKLLFVHIRGDQEVDEKKLRAALGLNPFMNAPFTLAGPQLLEKHGMVGGYCSLVGAKRLEEMIIVFDESVRKMKNAVVGANEVDCHLKGFCWERDLKKGVKYITFADIALRKVLTSPAVISICQLGEVQLTGSSGKLVGCPVYILRIQWLDVLFKAKEVLKPIYYVNMLTKKQECKDKFQTSVCAKGLLIVIDERPKVTGGQKKELADACQFNYVVVGRKYEEDGTVELNGVEVSETVL